MRQPQTRPDATIARSTRSTLAGIIDEATATRPAGMLMREAVRILIDERYERGILDGQEADYLDRLNGTAPAWQYAPKWTAPEVRPAPHDDEPATDASDEPATPCAHEPTTDGTACAYCGLAAVPVGPDELAAVLIVELSARGAIDESGHRGHTGPDCASCRGAALAAVACASSDCIGYHGPR